MLDNREAVAAAPSLPARVGRYEVLHELGRGGMGVVYKAWDPDLSRVVALKVLLAGEYASAEQLERFLREARAAAQLDHEHVVRVHDIGRDGERAFFTMDLVEGPSLQQVVDEQGRMLPREAVRVVAAVGRALYEAHRRGLVHRDVKPANILLQVDGTPLLADFGLATELRERADRITHTGQVLGTPAYLAPEAAIDGATDVGPLGDQYALGAVLYEVLAGVPPYDGTAMEILFRLVTGPPEPLASRRPELPHELSVMVDRAMAREPSGRYPTTLAFAEDLERWLRGEPVHARPPSVLHRVRFVVRSKWRVLLAAASLPLAIALGGWGWSAWAAWEEETLAAARETAAQARWTQLDAKMTELRASGRVEDANEAYRAFVEGAEQRGTAALAHAQWVVGGRLVDDGRFDEAVDELADAYGNAPNAAVQDEVLLTLAQAFHAGWQFDALDVVLETLVARSAPLATDPRLARWQGESRLSAGDVRGALAAWPTDDPARPLISLLVGAERAPHLDGDGRMMGTKVVVVREDDVVAVELQRGLPILERYQWEAGFSPDVWPISVSPIRLVDQDDAGMIQVLEGDPSGQLVLENQWWDGQMGAAQQADLDGDGASELYVGIGPYTRRLWRLDLSTGERSRLYRPIDAAASDVAALAAGDLNQDGRADLAVALGAWRAYDLRVLSMIDGEVRQVARRRIGFVGWLSIAPGDPPLLVVSKSDDYPTTGAFPSASPFGDPSGVYLMRLDGDRLVDEAFLPNPAPRAPDQSSWIHNAIVADVDGDGLDDVLASLIDPIFGANMLMFRRLPAGGWASVHVGGVTPWAVAQLDDDPALEVIVHQHGGPYTSWVLGVGDADLPMAPTVAAPLEAPRRPEVDDPLVLRAWDRALDLVQMGLVEQGARQLVSLATWVDDPLLADRARLQAAHLQRRLGQTERAASLYASAARSPELADEAYLGAVQVLAWNHRFDDAALLLDRWPGDVGSPVEPSLRAQIRAMTRDVSSWVLDPSVPLPAELRVLDGLAVRRDGDGLRADVFPNDGPVWEVPLSWHGQRLSLEADLSLHRVEWGSGTHIALNAPGGEWIGVFVRGWGGGELLEQEIGCGAPWGRTHGWRRRVSGPNDGGRYRVRIDVAVGDAMLLCSVTDADGRVMWSERVPLESPLSPGMWTLRQEPARHALPGVPMVASTTLHRLEVRGGGLTVASVASMIDGPGRAWAEGDLEGALAALGDDVRGPDAVRRVALLVDVGRWADAEETLRALLVSPDESTTAEVAQLLRLRGSAFGALLEGAVGSTYPAWFESAWSGALYAHRTDPEVRQALTSQLGGLEGQVRRGEGSAKDRVRGAILLLARGRSWLDLGETATGRRELRTAIDVIDALLGELDAELANDVRGRVAQAHQDLAGAELRAGQTDAAWRNLEAVLQVAPEAEIAFDNLAVDEDLASLRDDPSWASLRTKAAELVRQMAAGRGSTD